MNKIIISSILLLSGINLCAASSSSSEYSTGKNQYTIIVVGDPDVPVEEMQKRAIQKSAEVAKQNGYRYFTIKSRQSVYVQKSNIAKQQFSQNMYYDLIQSDNFGKGQLEGTESQEGTLSPGYRMVILGQKDNADENALDTCDYVKCS